MKKLICILLICSLTVGAICSCRDNSAADSNSGVNPDAVSSEPYNEPGAQITEVEVKASLSAESSTVLDITSCELFNALAGDRTPSNAILHLDDDLFVVADDGLYVPFEAAMAMCEESTIPVLYIESKKAAKALGERLNENGITDCIVMSDDAELVKTTRELAPKISGAIDERNNKLDDDITYLIQLRNEANSNNAKIILLSSKASREQVLYLQRRLMTVWVDSEDKTVDAHCNAFISGANGVVSCDCNNMFGAIDLFEKDTLFREVSIVGHRGQPVTNVDNTLSGAKAAIAAGADAIECDIQLTADMEFVIMHDNDISYYTSGKGKTEELKTEQIQYFILKGTKDEHIPKLQEFFEAFRDEDIIHTVEIKTSNPDAIYWLRDLIAQCGVSHQVNLISFNTEQLKLARQVMPEISCGYLGSIDGVYDNISQVLNTYNFSYHPVSSRMSPGNAYELNNRGISVNTWTYSDKNTLYQDILSGYASLTTDGSCWASEFVTAIEGKKSYKATIGETIDFTATAVTKTGEKKVVCEPVIVGGDDIAFTAADGGYTASAAGTVTVMLKYGEQLENGTTVYHYSQTTKVTIK